jgi:hypothetical protein
MAIHTLPQSPNGTKPHGRPGRVIPLLGPQVDHLLELRGLIRRAQEEERAMTAELLRALEAAGLTRLAGRQAVAVRDERVTLKPDPQRLLEAVGEPSWAALTVSVTAARRLLGEEDLAAISEKITTPVLRVEPLAPPAA